jgi:hypothetical protein
VLRLRRAEGPGISQGLEVDAVRDAETLHDLMNEGLNLGDRHIVLNVHKWVSAAAKLAAALDRVAPFALDPRQVRSHRKLPTTLFEANHRHGA